MKIAIVSQSYYPRPGGVTEHVHHTAEELARRGHDVTIVTSGTGSVAHAEPNVTRIGRNVLVPINGAWVNMTVGTRLAQDLKGTLKSLDPDVIHTHCPLAPTLPLMTLDVAPSHAKIVGTFHAAARGNMAYRLFRSPLGKLLSRIDTRIAVSQTARALASSYFPGAYSIIPNGVDCTRFSPRHAPFARFKDGAINVLFVGRLDRRKGLKHLFRAMPLVANHMRRQLRLIVVGDDGLRRHLLPRLPSSIDLVFTGLIDRDTLPRYFATGDVFCSPATERESFGIVLLEAMASGIPVIGTGIPGYLTILKDRWNSLVVPPRDPQGLADAIIEVADDEGLRRRLRRVGLQFAQNYRWDRIVNQLLDVYGQPNNETGKPIQSEPVQTGAQKA